MKLLLTDFASHCDGPHWTRALQAAVDACAAAGGGAVVIPPGEFLSGSIELRSHVAVEIEAGAVLRGSPELSDYPPVPFVHNEFGEVRSLFWAIGQRNIRLFGAGEVDFNHPAFMEMGQPDLRDRDSANFPLYSESQISEMTVVAKARPTQPVFFHDCERLAVEGLLLRQSPCWTLTFSACRDVKVRGITVENHLNVPNCDGVHVSASRDVLITGCVFHCADDCVAVGGITDWDRPSENIVISQCTMVSRSAAVRIGHLASKVRNVVCSDLVISDGNRGLLICAGDGGWIKNVRATNLIMHTRLFAGFWWGKGEPLAIMAAGSGRIESVAVAHVRGETAGGIVIAGGEGSIRDVSLDDWSLQISSGSNRPLLGGWIDLQPAECPPLEPGQIPWLYAEGVRQLHIRNVRASLDEGDAGKYSIEPILRGCQVEEPEAAENSRRNVIQMRTPLVLTMALAFLAAGCDRPAEPARPGRSERSPDSATPAPVSVVTIPEEFQTPPPAHAKIPPTPQILFAAKNFQVKTGSGIQGIMAGETVNVIRESGDEIVVQYGGLEFSRPRSFFSPTFVSAKRPQEPPAAAAPAPAPEPEETVGLSAPVPAAEPALPGESLPATPMRVPRLTAEEKKMAQLADSIRALNEKIRNAQDDAGRVGKKPTRSEMRALEGLKAERDVLSLQLTELGKP